MDSLFQGIQDEAGGGRSADFPANTPSGASVDHEGHVHKARPCAHVGKVDHPQGVGPADTELSIHPVQRALSLRIADSGNRRLCAPCARQSHDAHQPLHGALGHFDALAAHLAPDFARAIEAGTVIMDTFDLFLDVVVAPRTQRPLARVGKTDCVFMVRRRGERQLAADRLDTQFLTMTVDERHHHLPWRPSSACAKYADALRNISLARRSFFTSRSSSFTRSFSLAV
jgi:hypothetical protein